MVGQDQEPAHLLCRAHWVNRRQRRLHYDEVLGDLPDTVVDESVHLEEGVPRLLIRIPKIGVTARVSILVDDAVSHVVEDVTKDQRRSHLRWHVENFVRCWPLKFLDGQVWCRSEFTCLKVREGARFNLTSRVYLLLRAHSDTCCLLLEQHGIWLEYERLQGWDVVLHVWLLLGAVDFAVERLCDVNLITGEEVVNLLVSWDLRLLHTGLGRSSFWLIRLCAQRFF